MEDEEDIRKVMNLENLFDSKLGFDLMKEVELSKIELSKFMEKELFYSRSGVRFGSKLSRLKFHESAQDPLDKIMDTIDEALLLAELKEMDIDQVLCTGGSVQNPQILKLINGKFGEEKVVLSKNQDDVVGGVE